MTDTDRDPNAIRHPWALTDDEHHLMLTLAIQTVAAQTGCDEQTAADTLDALPTVVHSDDGFNYELIAGGNPIVHAQRDWLAATVGLAWGEGVPDDISELDP